MDFEFIMYHFLSGCIPVFLAVAIYFAILLFSEKKQTKGHIILSFVFSFISQEYWQRRVLLSKAHFLQELFIFLLWK